MKKVTLFVATIIFVFALSACSNGKETLNVLNWGEYMDESLVEQFEEEYNVNVVYDTVDSNEAMEVRIKAGTTKYDIAIPSDYMIDKLRQQNLLNEIDFDKLTGLDEVSFLPEVTALTANKDYNPYFVPYFWGTMGIMYNTNEVNVDDLTGFDVLFDPDTTYKIGMYDSARDAAAAAFLALGYDVNTNVEAEIDATETYMANGKYELFGTDNLKGLVQSGNLDMALVYSGDYFDQLYVAEEDEVEVNFGYFVPDTTNIWVDGFVIPTTSENIDLAHDFINFFLDIDVSATNADWVGYAPVIEEVYDLLVSDEYGYDYDNYDPYPDGTNRVIYEFVSDDRFARLNELLDAAKQ
jgi:spermidine/putrescine-binding protein